MLIALCCYSQNEIEGKQEEGDILENTVEQSQSDFNFDTYLETLQALRQNPLDLNRADISSLRNSGILSELQIRDLENHIQNFGPLVNLYELQTIPSFSLEDILAIAPYVTVNGQAGGSAAPLAKQLFSGKYQLYTRFQKYLELQRGYSGDTTLSSPYLGDNLRVYVRMKYNYQNRISYGFTAEKDPGEPFGGSYEPRGFDFYSAHFFRKSDGFLRALAIGDYQVRIGQGLTMWTGFGFGKSVYPVQIRRMAPVIAPYTSSDENLFFRGAAATFGRSSLQLTIFGSSKNIDAHAGNLDTIDNEILFVSSIDDTGLHRTVSELAHKDAIRENAAGADLVYTKGEFSIGCSAVYFHLSSPLTKDVSSYEIFDFEGRDLLNASVHYDYLWRNVLFFGETAMSGNKKFGTLNGLIIPIDPKIDIAFLFRYFDPGFQTLYASTFSDATVPQNEEGTYFGFDLHPVHAWEISAYADLYKHPWLDYLVDVPGYGTDLFGQITYQPGKNFQTYLRVKHEVSTHNVSSAYLPETLPLADITELDRSSIRWNADYDAGKNITLRSRVEWSFYDQQTGFPEKGYLLYQDVNYHPFGAPFSISTRYAIFNTASYNTRIYAYETDVLYAYSIVSLYGRGTRAYVTIEYSPFRWMDIWARIGQTWYLDGSEIGTGNDTFPGSKRSDAKLQVRLTW